MRKEKSFKVVLSNVEECRKKVQNLEKLKQDINGRGHI
jgi:hypothetical protein